MQGSDAPYGNRFRGGTEAAIPGRHVVVFGPFRLDPARRVLTADGQEVALQPRAFDILELFVACAGQVLTADEIVGHVWRGVAVGDNNLGVQLSALRRALAAHGGHGLVVTLPGRGHRFVGTVELEAEAARAPTDTGASFTESSLPKLAGGDPARWRQAAIATVALIAACAASVLAWRLVTPAAPPIATVAAVPFNPPPHSIAILAFANLSNDPAQEYLSDGFSEALIDELSRVNQLQVIARTSSFYFKHNPAPIDQIARRLNVAAVLEGSLRRQGKHLRIDAHLSDARTGFQLWSKSYDGVPDDLLRLQDEVARSVAEALRVKLVDADALGLNRGGTTNPQAFDAYMRGWQHLGAIGRENDAALLAFKSAAGLDPNFALAQSGLALVLALMSQVLPDDATYHAMLAQARRAADRAVQIAPGVGMTHAIRAMVLRDEVTDMTAAWQEAVRGRALSPGNAYVLDYYALIARTIGRSDEAIKAARRAVELDPLRPDIWWPLARSLACARRYDEAREAFLQAMTMTERPPTFAAVELGSLWLKAGDPLRGRKTCAEDTSGNEATCLAIADHALGRQADAEADLARLQSNEGDSAAYAISEIHAQWGQPELAVKWLKKARQMNLTDLWELKCDQWLDPIRGQPGYREVEQSLHFPPPE